MTERLSRAAILGALARGYCHEGNTHKQMDVDLLDKQADEIMALASLSRDSVIEECARIIHGRGDSAYCKASSMSKNELCLGEEFKIKYGTFTLENLQALEAVRSTFGEAFGQWEAAKAIRALKSAPADLEGYVSVPRDKLQQLYEYWNCSSNERAMHDALCYIQDELEKLLAAGSEK